VVRRPDVPAPAAGPATAPTGHAHSLLEPLSLPSPTAAWYTLLNEYGTGLGLGFTGDAGAGWTSHWLARSRPVPGFPPAASWLATSALDARQAWVLFAGPQPAGASYLYGTSDGGTAWRLITVFRPAG